MPELPEVETVVRGLRPRLVGRHFEDVRFLDPRFTRPVSIEEMEAAMLDQVVESVTRRGKYILWNCGENFVALIHLRMTGSFSAESWTGASIRRSHVRAVFSLDDGVVLRYHDPRRFGTFAVGTADQVQTHLDSRLGPEPLDGGFNSQILRAQLSGRSTPIKAALLDQRVVAGLGNIYVDEALHIAGIAPMVRADSLSAVRAGRLVDAIIHRLEEAIDAGGSTLRDYRGVEGADGTMQERFLVYGRGALPCFRCGRSLRSATIGGRTSVWCGTCQR